MKYSIPIAVLLMAALLGCADRKPAAKPKAEPARAAVKAGAVEDVSEADFDAKVLKSDKPVLVDFWAPWCKPCLQQAPIVEEVAREFEGRLGVAKVNVDEAKKLAARYGVNSIPTLMVFKDGQAVMQRIGVTDRAQLISEIEKRL